MADKSPSTTPMLLCSPLSAHSNSFCCEVEVYCLHALWKEILFQLFIIFCASKECLCLVKNKLADILCFSDPIFLLLVFSVS